MKSQRLVRSVTLQFSRSREISSIPLKVKARCHLIYPILIKALMERWLDLTPTPDKLREEMMTMMIVLIGI